MCVIVDEYGEFFGGVRYVTSKNWLDFGVDHDENLGCFRLSYFCSICVTVNGDLRAFGSFCLSLA